MLLLVGQVYKLNAQPLFAHCLIRQLSVIFVTCTLKWCFKGHNRSVSAFNGLFRVMTRHFILVDEEMPIPICLRFHYRQSLRVEGLIDPLHFDINPREVNTLCQNVLSQLKGVATNFSGKLTARIHLDRVLA